jgi:hypothetical protein
MKNKARVAAYNRNVYAKNKEQIAMRKKLKRCDEKEVLREREYQREYKKRFKLHIINYYGGKCACCGETRIEFLSIDHIKGGKGNPTKRESNFYRWIKTHGYPDDLRVLCMNCNFSRGIHGYCPHEREGLQLVSSV